MQGTASDLVVQIVLIAESMRLQAMMATYGIQTQTPHEVEPVQIWPPKELVKVYEHLGVSKRLGLQVLLDGNKIYSTFFELYFNFYSVPGSSDTSDRCPGH
jgi:hypothetical protein